MLSTPTVRPPPAKCKYPISFPAILPYPENQVIKHRIDWCTEWWETLPLQRHIHLIAHLFGFCWLNWKYEKFKWKEWDAIVQVWENGSVLVAVGVFTVFAIMDGVWNC